MDYNKVEDTVLKNAMNYFKESAVSFFGLDVIITEPAETEIKNVDIKTNYLDYLFHTKDGNYLHFEFQTTNKRDDLVRFLYYDASLVHRDKKKVKTMVIYSADITETEIDYDGGSIKYQIEAYYMKNINGDNRLNSIEKKINENNELTDEDILTLALAPLMGGKLSKADRTLRSIELADKISKQIEKTKCVTLLYALFEKFGDEKSKIRFKELISMTEIGRMLTEEGEARGEAKGKSEKAAEILIKLLEKKFNDIPKGYIEKIKILPEKVMDEITENIFEIKEIKELDKYLK